MNKINKKIIVHLLMSDKLQQKIKDYFSGPIYKEQTDNILKKFYILVEKWKIEMETHDYDRFKEIAWRIQECSKFKLPWTVLEVEQSVELFCKTFKIVIE